MLTHAIGHFGDTKVFEFSPPEIRDSIRTLVLIFVFFFNYLFFIRFVTITSIYKYILKYNGRIPGTAMSQLLQAQKLK